MKPPLILTFSIPAWSKSCLIVCFLPKLLPHKQVAHAGIKRYEESKSKVKFHQISELVFVLNYASAVADNTITKLALTRLTRPHPPVLASALEAPPSSQQFQLVSFSCINTSVVNAIIDSWGYPFPFLA